MSKKEHMDIVVIGSGPGGYAAAFRAADLGKKVLMVDRDADLGGVCLNRGCIPSKALLHISKVMNEVDHLSNIGVSFSGPTIDLESIRAYKEKIVSKLSGGISQLAKARNVTTLCGVATFESNTQLSVKTQSGDTKVSFDKCIIAAGSTSSMIQGAPKDHPSILTSRTALELNDVPETLLVIGGGVIGLELGQVYASLGSRVSVVEFLPGLIPGADDDIIKPLQRHLSKQFESIMLSSKVVSVSPKENNDLEVIIDTKDEKKEMTFNKVLVSVGRSPNCALLNLESTDIKLDSDGFIIVDEYQKTSVKNIFAIGNIIGNPMLAHKATHEGKVAAEVASGHPAAMDARAIPSVVYTDPEVAWVGLTESEAKSGGVPYEKGEFPWAASGKALIINAGQGKTKVLFDPETKQVLGAAIVGPSAGDLISEACLAIEMGSDVDDIGLTIHPHPTLGETFLAASEVYSGTITDLYIPPKGGK